MHPSHVYTQLCCASYICTSSMGVSSEIQGLENWHVRLNEFCNDGYNVLLLTLFFVIYLCVVLAHLRSQGLTILTNFKKIFNRCKLVGREDLCELWLPFFILSQCEDI